MNINALILFIIWPFASFISIFRGKFDVEFRNIIWLLCVFFSFGFIIKGDVGDSYRYSEELKEIHFKIRMGFDFSEQLRLIYTHYSDPFNPIVTYLVAFFTDDHRFLFGVYGVVYGYFYSSNILEILTRRPLENNVVGKFLGIYLILLLPIWNINGVRMWTGAQSLIYFFLKLNKNISGKLLFLLVPPFFHSAFILTSLISLLYLVVSPLLKFNVLINLYIILSVLHFFHFKFDIGAFSFLNDTADGGSDVYENKISAYNSGVEKEREAQSWFLVFQGSLEMVLFFLGNIFYYVYSPKINFFEQWKGNMNLFLMIFFMLISFHPSSSAGRYLVFNHFIIFLFGFINYHQIPRTFLRFIISVVVLFCVLFILVIKIRFGFEFFNYGFFLGNMFTIYFLGNDISMLDFYYALFGKYSS